MPRAGIEIRGTTNLLMFAVLITAILFAGIRSQREPAAAIAIVALVIVALAARRYAAIIAERVDREEATSRLNQVKLAGSCVAVAAALVGMADLVFLATIVGILNLVDEICPGSCHQSAADDPRVWALAGCAGLALALWVATRLRRTLWPHSLAMPLLRRLRPAIWPLGVAALVVLTMCTVEMKSRWSFCTMMAEFHDQQVRAAIQINDTKSARLHATLADWYRHSTWRPWLPVHPR